MISALLFAASVASTHHLPPVNQWSGKSTNFFQPHNPLATQFERSLGVDTFSYDATLDYLNQLQAKSNGQFQVIDIGQSDAGKPIPMVIAAQGGKLSNSKPTILLQAGIHAGEIDGNDAVLMMLRDIVQGKRNDILSRVNLLFVPILNVDGHENSSPYNRINQRGPNNMGFRTNGRNLNLNRDYTKLETPGVRAVIAIINKYKPDLYVDLHVTDGADYQYDITYGFSPEFASSSPQIAKVLSQKISPIIDQKLANYGHIPGPLTFVMNKRDLKQGLAGWVATPKFSNGWGDLANVPTILLENHSLKPYKQRVLGTYVFVDGIIDAMHLHYKPLRRAAQLESEVRPRELIVKRGYSKKPNHIDFKGIKYEKFISKLSGQQEVRYTGEPELIKDLPIYWQKEALATVKVPTAYYLPKSYASVAAKLQQHGIKLERVYGKVSNLKQIEFVNYKFDSEPFEGAMRVAVEPKYVDIPDKKLTEYYKVSTAQPRGKLAVHLLQPEAEDSFLRWGYFNTSFQRTEYVENYALIPFINKLFEQEPQLKAEFEAKLKAEPEFSASAKARLNWLYQKTPYYDGGYLKYPVLIEY